MKRTTKSNDGDLKSPLHDEILLWANENIEKIVGEILRFHKEYKVETKILSEINQFLKTQYLKEKERLLGLENPFSEYHVKEKLDKINSLFKKGQFNGLKKPPPLELYTDDLILEYPIENKKMIVGFADLRLFVGEDFRFYIPQIKNSNFEEGNFKPWIEHLGYQNKVSYVGPQWMAKSRYYYFLFMIKPQVLSLKELIKEIRTYERYENKRAEEEEKDEPFETKTSNRFFVISPDSRWKNIIEEQGIGFVLYPGKGGK